MVGSRPEPSSLNTRVEVLDSKLLSASRHVYHNSATSWRYATTVEGDREGVKVGKGNSGEDSPGTV